MPNYQDGKIYMIWCGDHRYYGSTCDSLCRRLAGHKKKVNTTTSKMIFDIYGVENCKIELVELFPCHSKEELNAREGFYIRSNECVNKRISGQTGHEYRESNREIIAEKRKQHYNENKEAQSIRMKNYYAKTNVKVTCECGGVYSNTDTKNRHLKTQKHIRFTETQLQQTQ